MKRKELYWSVWMFDIAWSQRCKDGSWRQAFGISLRNHDSGGVYFTAWTHMEPFDWFAFCAPDDLVIR